MSHPSPDLPEPQPPALLPSPASANQSNVALTPVDLLAFKVPGGVLVTTLGVLNGLTAFAQVLTDLIFAPWHLLLLSMIWLTITLAVTGAGVWMLLLRGVLERMSPLVGMLSTGALLVFMVAAQLISERGLSGLLVPVALSIPTFIVVGRGLSRMTQATRAALKSQDSNESTQSAASSKAASEL